MSGWGFKVRENVRVVPLLAVIVAGLWIPFGCGEGRVTPYPGAIESSVFMDTYVDLRMATLRAGVTQLPTGDRNRILEEHGVSEKDLLTFVEVHGRDAGFMHTIWDSIESRIDEERIGAPDSTEAEDPGSA